MIESLIFHNLEDSVLHRRDVIGGIYPDFGFVIRDKSTKSNLTNKIYALKIRIENEESCFENLIWVAKAEATGVFAFVN